MWAHAINAALGIWLIVAPAVLQYAAPAQTNDRVVGPLVATFAIVAWWEATRSVGRANFPFGLWLLLAPWVLGYGSSVAVLNSVIVGAVVAALSLVRGRIEGRYGGGWSVLWSSSTAQDQTTVRSNGRG